MNYCDKIKYHIYTAEKNEFSVMVEQLLAKIPSHEVVLRLVFFGTPSSNKEYVTRKRLLREKVDKHFGEAQPTLSYVSQPPLDAPLIVEVHSLLPDPDDRIHFRSLEEHPYVVLENAVGRFLFAGGFQGEVEQDSIQQQSEDVFDQVEAVLEKEQFPIEQITRQWNYIERITSFEGEDQHYQAFNNARSAYYAQSKWTKGYPAATGIGANLGGILVDLDAVVFRDKEAFVTAIDNKLQVAAHAYSENVLENACNQKTTPKFERAKSLTLGDRRLVYISGTAAIRGEESLHGVGLEKQLQITMENIMELINDATIKLLRVYLKYPEDYEEAVRLMDMYALNIPISYMWADVCRDELLIEIEGIAVE